MKLTVKKMLIIMLVLFSILASIVLFVKTEIPAQYTDTVIEYGESNETDLLVWGDSWSRNIAEGISQNINISNQKVINAGISGCGLIKTENFVTGLDENISDQNLCAKSFDRAREVLGEFTPKTTLFVMGTFDVRHNLAEDKEEDWKKYEEKYIEAIELMESFNTTIYVTNIFISDNLPEDYQIRFGEMNALIDKIALEKGIDVIDINDHIRSENLQIDATTHLDNNGQTLIGKWMVEQLLT